MSLWDVSRVSDLPKESEISWALRNYLPLGAVSMLGGPGGVGKSVLVAALEVAIASGKPFLEAEVHQGAVLHLNFDTDARLQGPWYARVARGMGVPEEVSRLIHYAAPSEEGSPFLTRERLEAHRQRQQAKRALLGETWPPSDLVFTSEVGTPYNPHNVARLRKQLMKEANMPLVRLHDLRHLHASLAIKGGMDPKMLADRLGHAKASFTMDVYTHLFDDQRANCAVSITAYLNAGKAMANRVDERSN